jgi:linoleoyl-CoA desaturase
MRKAIINYTMWFTLYAAYLFVGAQYGWYALLLVLPLAFAMLCIVLSVMHDGSHGAFSNSRFINSLASYSLAFAGGSPILWRQLHVRAHHDNTNVIGYDQDFESGGLIRLHPAQVQHKAHHYQHLYAWFLYMGHSIRWIWFDDIKDYITNRWPVSPAERTTLLKEIILAKDMACRKLSDYSRPGDGQLAARGCLLSRALDDSERCADSGLRDGAPHARARDACLDELKVKQDWALHQLATTVDFATKNRVLSWIVGGLNFQIEHHIFPKISHTRYKLIQPVVKEYCAKARRARF